MCNVWLHIGGRRATFGCTSTRKVNAVSTSHYEIERDILIEAPVDVVWRTVTERSKAG